MQPYISEANSLAVRLRWINVQCYEIELPNRKIIVTDPFYLDSDSFRKRTKRLPAKITDEFGVYLHSGFSAEDFTGADYILLNHIHADHANLVGDLWRRFYGRILVPGDCALEIAQVFDIPYAALYPLYPGNTYYFDDFTLQVFPGAHDNRVFREGSYLTPSAEKKRMVMMPNPDLFNMPWPNNTWGLGSIHNLNYVITTKNNFKIDFSAGRDFEEHVQHMQSVRPNLMLRHRIRSDSPEECAKQIETLGAQLMLPLHHNNARATEEDLNEYFQKVNEILAAGGSAARAFNPEPNKWYQVQTSIVSE